MFRSTKNAVLLFFVVVGLIISGAAAFAQDVPGDYQDVLKLLDRKGDFKAGVLKVNIPRNDLKMTIQGFSTPTPFGLGGWIALTKATDGSDVMMGDLVVLQDEKNPVLSALLDNGIDVTALHNHFFWDDPHVFYMHVHGMGKAADLARRVKPGLDLIGQLKPEVAAPVNSGGTPLDTGKLAKIAGHEGEQSGAVYKITVGRDDLGMKEHGAVINARMGLNTWAAFVGTEEDAVVAGDVAMLEDEVTPVLKALRKNGLDVAIHHHMTGDRPVVIFLHYWGRGPAEKPATGFKAALNELGKGTLHRTRWHISNPIQKRSLEACMRNKRILTVGFVLVSGVLSLAASPDSPTLKKVAEFDLPGPGGKRFDYLAIDTDDHYLFSAHLAAGQTYVIDLRTNKLVATVTDTPGVEGIEYVAELKKFYTSNAGDNTIGVVDLRQMKVVKKISTERKPDGSAYAAPFHKLYVSDERGKAEAIVDVTKDEVVKTLHFDSETGMPQYDPVARKVYVNLQDQNIFAVIDPASDEVVDRYAVGRCKGNHGMTLDPEHHRALLSCEGNNLMTVFDLDKHEPIAFLPLADGPDVIKFDPGLGRIYAACYSGAISVFHQDDPNHYRKIEDFKVPHAVHTLAVDQETHRVYTPEQEADGKPVARMVVYDAVTKP